MYDERIVRQIREAAAKYEKAENSAVDLECLVNLSFVDKLNNGVLSDLATISAIHAQIIEQERIATNVHLVVTYQRSLLYLNARKFVTEK